jgi:HrpA-like RNA helicase
LDESILNKQLIKELVLKIISNNCSREDVVMSGPGQHCGAILIFVDGFAAIKDVIDILRSVPALRDPKKAVILPLHSSLSTAGKPLLYAMLCYPIHCKL